MCPCELLSTFQLAYQACFLCCPTMHWPLIWIFGFVFLSSDLDLFASDCSLVNFSAFSNSALNTTLAVCTGSGLCVWVISVNVKNMLYEWLSPMLSYMVFWSQVISMLKSDYGGLQQAMEAYAKHQSAWQSASFPRPNDCVHNESALHVSENIKFHEFFLFIHSWCISYLCYKFRSLL